ncbi:hypothetical protein F5888DRAFT_1673895 [Russula emetica]|nr:hypothetical protein F5888DRAFT_1673895 [Russula emetica]
MSSAHHTSPLRPHGEDLLKAALSDPFSVPPDLPRVSPSQPQSPSSPPPPLDSHPASDPTAPVTEPSSSSSPSASISVSSEEQEAWRGKYDAQVVEWRRQSADVRARAEAERARWEERRAREREQQQQQQALMQGIPRANTGVSAESPSTSTSEWEAVSVGTTQRSASSESAPSHSQQEGPPTQNLPRSTSSNAPPTRTAPPDAGPQARTGDPSDSPPWESVLSPTSSFPSMSFPEPSRPHSPAPRETTTTTTLAASARPATTASVTLAIFDHALPVRTRIWALFSSLSINMFLPFVNGVMLGFGEIFAKTVIVEWLGWGPTVVTNVGLGASSQNRSKRRWWW